MSHTNLWTVAFLKGNDKKDTLRANLSKTFVDLRSWGRKTVMFKEEKREICVVTPCDMSTQNSLTEAVGMTCFRCKERHQDFRIMFAVVQVMCSLRELGTATDTSPQDLFALNSASADIVSEFLFSNVDVQ